MTHRTNRPNPIGVKATITLSAGRIALIGNDIVAQPWDGNAQVAQSLDDARDLLRDARRRQLRNGLRNGYKP